MARYIVLRIDEDNDGGWMNLLDIVINTDDLIEAVRVFYNSFGDRIIDTEEGVIMWDSSDAVKKVYQDFKWMVNADRPTQGIGNFGPPRCVACDRELEDTE